MEKFIESVRKQRHLWDTSCADYRDIDMKETAWQAVADQCGISSGKQAKGQWKKLRDSHREALRRRRSAGQAAQKIMPWKYEECMKFVLPLTTSTDSSNFKINASEQTHEERPSELLHSVGEPKRDNRSASSKKRKHQSCNTFALAMPTQYQANITKDDKEKRRKEKYKELDELKRQNFEALPMSRDPLTALFTSLCEKTRCLPVHLQLRVQRELFNTVALAEEEAYHSLADSPSQTSYDGSAASSPPCVEPFVNIVI